MIGSRTTAIGWFTPRELVARYRSLVACEGIWVLNFTWGEWQREPLWYAVQRWYDFLNPKQPNKV